MRSTAASRGPACRPPSWTRRCPIDVYNVPINAEECVPVLPPASQRRPVHRAPYTRSHTILISHGDPAAEARTARSGGGRGSSRRCLAASPRAPRRWSGAMIPPPAGASRVPRSWRWSAATRAPRGWAYHDRARSHRRLDSLCATLHTIFTIRLGAFIAEAAMAGGRARRARLAEARDANPGGPGGPARLPCPRDCIAFRPTFCCICMGSNGSYLHLAPVVAERESSPLVGGSWPATRTACCGGR
jgi:hypothetical protein